MAFIKSKEVRQQRYDVVFELWAKGLTYQQISYQTRLCKSAVAKIIATKKSTIKIE